MAMTIEEFRQALVGHTVTAVVESGPSEYVCGPIEAVVFENGTRILFGTWSGVCLLEVRTEGDSRMHTILAGE